MKRFFALVLCLLMAVSLISCGPKTPAGPAATDTPEPTAAATPEPTADINALDYSEKQIGAAELFENCKVQGRTTLVNYKLKNSEDEKPGIALDYTAAAVEFNAYCEGTLAMTFRVKSTGIGGSRLYVSVYVDGEQMGEHRADYRLTKSAATEFVLAEGLSRGLHNIRIERQTEAERGVIYIDSVRMSGEFAPKPSDNEIFIEFIGDSITTGYGNLYPNDADGEKGTNAAFNEYVDGTRTYAVLAAKAIGADYSVVAQQGIGFTIGWQPHTMLQTYTETCYQCDRHEEWTFPRKADIVVINLGTNDEGFYHSGACTFNDLKKGIRDFLTLVREKNPDSQILWVYGMMAVSLGTEIEAAIKEFGGAEKGYYFLMLEPNGSGGNGHPNLAAHAKNAKTLEAKLREMLNK